tara:strand:- start:13240 stop:13839 length:600 start_codon:yes stop_codon:yes gene_type:complete
MKLTLVRHGQTESNMQRILEGNRQGQLTVKGKEQAKKVGERLKEEQYDFIYISDLQRAKQTAQEILKFHETEEIIYTEKIRERKWGELEGKSYAELSSVKQQLHFAKHKPKEGETFEELQKRIVTFYEELLAKHQGKRVLVIAHAGVIGALLLHLLEKESTREEYLKVHPKNTAITVLEISDDKQHKVYVLNCINHLDT